MYNHTHTQTHRINIHASNKYIKYKLYCIQKSSKEQSNQVGWSSILIGVQEFNGIWEEVVFKSGCSASKTVEPSSRGQQGEQPAVGV